MKRIFVLPIKEAKVFGEILKFFSKSFEERLCEFDHMVFEVENWGTDPVAEETIEFLAE